MQLDQTTMVPATLVKRYKRFLSDHRLESGEVITASCPNTGTMLGLTTPGSATWLVHAPSPTRKYDYRWELIEDEGTWVGINTGRPNALVEEAIRAGVITELAGYADLRREVKYGTNSRIDLLLEDPGRPQAFVEVKNCHLRREAGLAEFPDSITTRGAKHLDELAAQVALGHRAVMVFCVQRADCDHFDVAADIDPGYAVAFQRARAAGVEALAYVCHVSAETIALTHSIPIKD
ncbi:MAG: DNA/RNA nuclease SfsA [Alphaproteobacteria bacterium]|nr:DNA/RNA nuclease SfsA [Pseudomonadota bacterium]HCI00996.1 DNA/RNA nuclease SfsA [Alphaproteobacteria bacterium]